MPNMFRNFSYPGTDFHEMNLEWLVNMCQKFVGLALNVSGDKLRLVNENGEVVSSVTVSYATKALTDQNGKNIDTYIFSVAGVGDTVVFTHGDGTSTAITVPYADKAKYDLTGHELEDYIYNVQIAGDALRITHGDGTIVDLTIPYAVKATKDANGKVIDTYGASLTVENDNVCLRDSMGRLLNSITVPYATKALNDVDGDAIKSTYAGVLTTGTTTVILKAKDGTVLNTITVPFATEASHAVDADLATVATDCTNAIETVAISGDYIVFTTYGGQAYSIQAPFAVKAQKDDLGNTIKTSYVAGVTNDPNTGKLQFRDAMGNIIVELLPTVDTAVHDDYGNAIADYVKTIVASSNSDYITVTHGDGDVDTITVHYSDTAWKDTNGNVIKNTYIKSLSVEEDVNDGHYKLVAYNGDTPQAELFRIDIVAYSAQTDINGKALTSYVADVDYNASKQIEVTDGEGNVLKTLANELENVANVNIDSGTLADGDVLTYVQADDEWQNKPASGGGADGPYYALDNGLWFTPAQILTDTWGGMADILYIPLCGPISASMSNLPTVVWGNATYTDDYNVSRQDFEIKDTSLLNSLFNYPIALTKGGTTYSFAASEVDVRSFFNVNFARSDTQSRDYAPSVKDLAILIDNVKVEYDANFNSGKPYLSIKGSVRTGTVLSTASDLLYYFDDITQFTNNHPYLQVSGAIQFTHIH